TSDGTRRAGHENRRSFDAFSHRNSIGRQTNKKGGRAMETLVLTASYEPVARVSWKRAVTLLFDGKVEVIEEYEDRFIRSVTLESKMPSVIRFLRVVRTRKKTPKFSRENVYARDNGRCQYCAKKVARSEATYDHVVLRALGGKTTWENVVICCVPCNQKKGAR